MKTPRPSRRPKPAQDGLVPGPAPRAPNETTTAPAVPFAPWECPRCGAINAPSATQCTCPPGHIKITWLPALPVATPPRREPPAYEPPPIVMQPGVHFAAGPRIA